MSDERKLTPGVATPQDDHTTGGTFAAGQQFAPPPDDHATIGEPVALKDKNVLKKKKPLPGEDRVVMDDHTTGDKPKTGLI
ncbi:hypothetical protein B7P34_11870 [Streptosporangium nondiastaticum]|uniref:Uncharacterized protein n=2 Tax=Actinomycetes TaxID=1760 RepID=A0A9X7PHW4_9ACTN|nr:MULTISPECIES: hypothetical protein [Actinomycetes]PSJ28554.1 hypothetical protein B7P34_11870 [Streptosporangium nondiastaticum]WKU45349.1 hypothetical protein Q3V23_15455 [Streptomyces sp. VNUA116]